MKRKWIAKSQTKIRIKRNRNERQPQIKRTSYEQSQKERKILIHNTPKRNIDRKIKETTNTHIENMNKKKTNLKHAIKKESKTIGITTLQNKTKNKRTIKKKTNKHEKNKYK